MNSFVPISQNITNVGLLVIIIPNVFVSGADILNDFGISFLCQSGSFVYFL